MYRSVRFSPARRAGVARALVLSAFIVGLLVISGPTGLVPSPGAQAVAPHRPAAVKVGGIVTIDNVSGALWSCGFNPYGPTTNYLSAGIFYEPLYYVSQLDSHQVPWLATSYSWGKGNRTLTFVMRKGVTWSDGKPLTPADVVFTFNLLKKFPGLDQQAVWTVLSGVKQQGNSVVFTFKQPAVPFFYYIADQNFILPQHTWGSVKNPVTFTDKHPMGSGPFLLKSCSPQNITYVRNPHYWQKGKPYVSEVRYPAFMGNPAGNLYLSQGQANWGGQFIPNVQAYYLSHDTANRHIWYPPLGADVLLYLNLTQYPLNVLAVRQAISLGIDRNKISRLGVYGYLPPSNQSGIILPTWQSWFDKSLASQYNYSFNPSKAISLLQKAGFKRGSDGIFQDKHGKRLSFKLVDNGGFTDWVAENKIIQNNLHDIGIEVTDLNLTQTDQVARLGSGNFQLGYYGPTGGPSPYFQYRQLLDSANSAPIGKTATSNYERYFSQQADSLLNQYAATSSTARQHQIINQIQKIMLTDVPIIPVLESVNWYQYDTSQIVGWPTPSNPYAAPAPYNFPDWEVILTTIHQK